MKNSNLSKLSRAALKNITGGKLYPSPECTSSSGCHRYGEVSIKTCNGTYTMSRYGCVGGKCIVITKICPPLIIKPNF